MMKVKDVVSLDFYGGERYVVARVLQGGMGTVLQLVPTNPDACVIALKTVQAKASIRAFDEECDAWMSVGHHPNIARALQFGTLNGIPCIAMDWYPRALGDAAVHQLDDAAIERIFFETAAALHHAHREAGLVHQDIKPANILLDGHDMAKLADFGLARCLVSEGKSRLVDEPRDHLGSHTSSRFGGTPFFMAPELFRGAKPSVVTDLFSLGTTFYFLCTGQHPFFDTNGRPVSPAEQSRRLQRFVEGRGGKLRRVASLIERCIAFEPGERCSGYAELLDGRPAVATLVDEEDAKLETIVVRALMRLERGRPEAASRLLDDALSVSPGALAVLWGRAQLEARQGNHADETTLLRALFERLDSSSGPKHVAAAMRWARINIDQGNFDAADTILEKIFSWYMLSSRPLAERLPYAEAGWFLLLRGEFQAAADHLVATLSRKPADQAALKWLVEASWLANTITDCADLAGDGLSRFDLSNFSDRFTRSSALARLLLRQFSSEGVSSKLWSGLPSFVLGDAFDVDKALGLKPGSLLEPRELAAQQYIIAQLDEVATGGRHHGLVRQVAESRLA